MAVAALITWIVTAALGLAMFAIWASHGGIRAGTDMTSRFRPPIVFGHLLLAVTGLAVWIVYVVNDSTALAWIAVVDLVIVAGIGDTLVMRWFKDRRTGPDLPRAPSIDDVMSRGGAATVIRPAEQRIPSAVVVTHGTFAVVTVVLVLLAALEVGGS